MQPVDLAEDGVRLALVTEGMIHRSLDELMDWLDEQGDPRGELLRLLHTLTQELSPPQRPALEAQLRDLLERGVELEPGR